MKKQKFMKLTAFTSSPSLENSFSAPATHDGEVSVVFSGKNVKIHGWDGSVWSVIYTWDSVDKEHTFDNTFDNYFLESLTGQEETMSVSFFSVDRYQGSTPSLAGVTREVKLYDVDEVPIYTASDAGKMLTIMSDGSLRWLGASVTWMIDGSPVPESGGSHVEDRSDLTLEGTATLNNSILSFDGAGYATIPDGFRYTDNLTVSVWFKTSASGDRRIISSHIRNAGYNGFFIMLSNGQLFYRHPDQAADWTYGPTGLNDGEWHHFAMTYEAGGQWVGYLDGAQIDSGAAGAAMGYLAEWPCYIGANGWNGNNPYGHFIGEINDIKIENVTRSSAEIISDYNSGLNPTGYVEDRNDLTLGAGTTIVDSVVYVGNDVTSSLQVGGVGAAGPFRSLFETYEFSVSFFMKTTNTGNAMLVTDCWAGTFNGWFVYLSSTGHLQFVNGAGGGELSSPTTANQLRDGNWHHVVCTVAPDSTNKVYIDGVEFCSINLGGNRPFDARSALTFGWIDQGQVAAFGGYPLDGQMDQIQIHDSTLSAAEVTALYDAGNYSETVVLDENGHTFVRANGDFLNLGDDPAYDRAEGADFAVEGEFRTSSDYGSATWDIIGKGQTSGWWGWAVILYGGYIRMFAHSAGSVGSGHGMNASFTPVVGQWYHFKAIWKADGTQELWVDGVKLADRVMSNAGYLPPVDSSYDLLIGDVFTNQTRNFDGDMRNIKIQSGVIN